MGAVGGGPGRDRRDVRAARPRRALPRLARRARRRPLPGARRRELPALARRDRARASSRSTRSAGAPGGSRGPAIALCAVTAVPGVVDQDDLDARLVNAVPALGVALALGLTLAATRAAGGSFAGRLPLDPLRLALGVVVLRRLDPVARGRARRLPPEGVFIMERPGLEADGTAIAAVHLGHHHGLDGALLVLSALLLSRPPARPGPPGTVRRLYLSLMLGYGGVNLAQDAWNEQLVKRGWVDWRSRPRSSPGSSRSGSSSWPSPRSTALALRAERARRRLARWTSDEVLRRAAELATDWFDSSAERPIAPTRVDRRAPRRAGRPPPRDGRPRPRGDRGARARRRAGSHRDGVRAVLRLRDRRHAPRRARRRLARLRLGPERRARCCRPRPRRSSRRSPARGSLELLGLPATASFAFVTGCQMAHTTALAVARDEVLAPDRLERGRARAPGRAAAPGRRRGEAPRHRRPGAAPARDRHRPGAARPLRRPGPDARGAPPRRARARATGRRS